MTRRARRNPREGGYDDRGAREVASSVIDHAEKKYRVSKSPWMAPKANERGIVNMIDGWLSYADMHRVTFGSPIGEDYVLGPMWLQIGASIRGLLNGEIGRLDGGTVDAVLLDVAASQGFSQADIDKDM